MSVKDGRAGAAPTAEEYLAMLLRAERAEEKLRETEAALAFYKASADAMPNPIFIKDEELRFVFFNRAYKEFFGLEGEEYIGGRVQDMKYLSPEEKSRFHREDSEILANQSVMQYEAVFHPEEEATESLYWSKGFQVPSTGARGLVGEIVDISGEKKLQRELSRSMQALEMLMKDAEDASKIDPVTNLFNRRVLTDDMPRILEQTAAMGQPACIMIMDIDYFKQINDSFGHPFGDEILRKFAALLKSSFRQSDIAVRYGGDEFVMVLPGANLQQAREIAERLCTAARRELLLPDGGHATISVGVAERRGEEEIMTFISRADEALYAAKRSGRNRVAAK